MTKSLISKYKDNNICGEALFLAAYGIFLTQILFQSTLFISTYPVFNSAFLPLMRKTAYLLIMIKLGLDLCCKRYLPKEIIIAAGAAAAFTLTAVYSGRKDILLLWIFVFASKHVEFKKIIFLSLAVHVVFIPMTMLCSAAGVIDDRIFIRGETGAVRHSFGFMYSSQPAHYIFYTLLMWIYVRKEKIAWAELICLAAVTVFIYKTTDTKSPFVLSLTGIAGAITLKLSVFLRKYKKWYSAVAVGIVPLTAAAIFLLTYSDSVVQTEFIKKLNSIVTGRLFLAHQGFGLFGFKPFGQEIVWFGGSIDFYHYVDSSYMNILFNLGYITLILLVIWGARCGYAASKHKDTYFVLAIALAAVHSMFDVTYAMMDYNVFICFYTFSEAKIKHVPDAVYKTAIL